MEVAGLVKLHEEAKDSIKNLNIDHIQEMSKGWPEGARRDVLNLDNGSLYYKWFPALIQNTQPKQIVELGGAMGASALCMLSTLPHDSVIYSITLPEGGLEFSFVNRVDSRLKTVLGDDLDLNSWPKELDFSKTDILFVDAEHTEEQLRKELDLYLPLVGSGTLIVVDDIKLNDGLWKVWKELQYPKLDVSELHHSGFGIFYT